MTIAAGERGASRAATDRAVTVGTRAAALSLAASGLVLGYAMAQMQVTPWADWAGPIATTLMAGAWLLSVLAPVLVGAGAAAMPHRPMLQQAVVLTTSLGPLLFMVFVFMAVLGSAASADPGSAKWSELEGAASYWYLVGAAGFVVAAGWCAVSRLSWFGRGRVSATGWVLWLVTVVILACGAGMQVVIAYFGAVDGGIEIPTAQIAAVIVSIGVASLCLMTVAFHPVPSARRGAAFWCAGVLFAVAGVVTASLVLDGELILSLFAFSIMTTVAAVPIGAGVMLTRGGGDPLIPATRPPEVDLEKARRYAVRQRLLAVVLAGIWSVALLSGGERPDAATWLYTIVFVVGSVAATMALDLRGFGVPSNAVDPVRRRTLNGIATVCLLAAGFGVLTSDGSDPHVDLVLLTLPIAMLTVLSIRIDRAVRAASRAPSGSNATPRVG